MSNLENMRKKMQIKKAESAIAELEFKIVEREIDLKRMRQHIEKQKEIIKTLGEGL